MKDAVDRLTPLAVMVLALLREGDMHPYEMLRLMRQRRADRLVTITNGTMYHTVARLGKLGLVREVGTDRDGNRPERTTYALAEAGRDTVGGWVRQELSRIDRPTEFRVALAEAHNISREEVVELLTIRRTALSGEHSMNSYGLSQARGREVPEQYLVEVERQEALTAAEIGWLDELITRLERAEFPWGNHKRPDQAQQPERHLTARKATRS